MKAILHAAQLVTLAGPKRARVGPELSEVGIIRDGGMLIDNGIVLETGPSDLIERKLPIDTEVIDAAGRVVLPGFVDAHTHLVFAGNRVDEFELRARGASYEEIAASGGGIRSTVRKTRAATDDELQRQALKHANWFLQCGTTTVEAKSGYGLSLEDELRILRAIREVGKETQLELVPTFLGAHAIPEEFKNTPERYVETVINEMLPAVAADQLAEYCDIFCERGYFDIDTSRRILSAAKQRGLRLRMHVDQLTNSGGAALAAELRAATADHLEQTETDGIAALKKSGVQPVLLPASVYALGKMRYPRARDMIDAGLALVLATDFNPGSSPTPSLPMVFSLAVTQMKMTPAEALTAATINAAHSLQRGDEIGSLEPGKRANFAIFDCEDFRELAYYFGIPQTHSVYVNGERVFALAAGGLRFERHAATVAPPMKIEVENQPHSVATLRIELPPEDVRKEWDAIAGNYARYARIPGYRTGKAPRPVIEKKFRKEIQEELTKKLVSKSYHEAIAQKQLRVVSLTNLEDVEFGEDRSMRFRATVVTAPEFELPEYKNIPVELSSTEVTEAEVDAALERLREQSADFTDITDRPIQMEDFAVIDFDGSVEGVAISELVPDASKNLHGGKKFWIRIAPDNFLPQFVEQMVGMNPGETRSIQVDFPADFAHPAMANKKADYAVTLNEMKQKVLPALDDAFAEKLAPGKTLADLRHMIEHDLEHEKEHEIERAKESQIVKYLQEHITFDLPPVLLKNETRRALNELVHRNRERGVPDELLKGKEKELVEGAGSLAAHRLKTNFILHRIAEQEKIQITREEIDERIRAQAAQYNVPVEKMRKELEEHDRIDGLAEEILLGKTLDFLKSNVSVQPSLKSPAAAVSAEEK